ncbi:conserved exported hypothetical protein [Candidatus Terasakiella magnetica]|uniref:Sel1 repeat family protein n=2 Tax=Candidatus Terasakiella magnetica TaxID=1867952 RepID=A0A1C3RLD0_9PROT|nr:conserved exported hypothetical protein [Candidatus Terasakiella magnetica]
MFRMMMLLCFVIAVNSPALAQGFGEKDSQKHSMITSLKAYAVYKMGQYDEAYALWLPIAEAGNTTAMINIANMYLQGQGRAVDIAKARAWLLKAQEAGDERAAEQLLEIEG